MAALPETVFDPSLLSRIENAGLNASAPPEQCWIDGWLVRFARGQAKRARCINAVASGRLALDDRLAACEKVFDGAGLPMIVRITPFSQPPGLDQALAQRRFQRFDGTRVMVLASGWGAGPTPEPKAANPTIEPLALADFVRRIGDFRNTPEGHRAAHLTRLSAAPVRFAAFQVLVENRPVACGQYALEGDVVGLYDVFTAAASRRQGSASRLCRHLLDHAHGQGARHAYLQVEAANPAACAVYRRLGFVDAYAYHYRARDPSIC